MGEEKQKEKHFHKDPETKRRMLNEIEKRGLAGYEGRRRRDITPYLPHEV